MKLKIITIVLTTFIIVLMWNFSPKKRYIELPQVETIHAKREDVYDTVPARGRIEENNNKSIRLDKTAKIENIYVGIGDYVEKGTILMEVSECENTDANIDQISKFLPEIKDVSDIEDFYIPKTVETTTKLTPEIKAPISGVITDIDIKKGDVVLGQLPIVTISDFKDLRIKASVPEFYIKDIKLGQKAEITGEAFSGQKHMAYISEISPTATTKTTLTGNSETSVDITLVFSSNTSSLRPGYSVNAKIFTKSHKGTTTIPYTCIFQENDKEYVYILTNDKLVKKAVKTGFELTDRVEVRSGIKETDCIINNPTEDLENNMRVRAVKQ